MKKSALILLALPLTLTHAENTPKPPVPPAPPAPTTPAVPPAPTPPGAVPVAPAPEKIDLGPFKTEQERRSYALGVFFANRAKSMIQQQDNRKPNADEVAKGVSDFLDDKQSKDYLAGLGLGAMIKQDGIEVDREVLLGALKEVLAGGKSKIDDKSLQADIQSVGTLAQQNRDAKNKADGEKNLKEAEAFLEKNKGEKDVVTLPSGLQYQVITKAEGKKPDASEVAVINYKGTLINGEEFDKSPESGHKMRLTGPSRIEGLREGVALMTIGSKYKFWVAPKLGFGEQPSPTVRPNSLLIYEVELTASEPAPPPQPAPAPGQPFPGGQVPPVKKPPVTAVTPPISIDIPPQTKKDGAKPEEKKPEEKKEEPKTK